MFDDFQSSIPWKTVSCSHHAPEMTREEKRKKGGGEKSKKLISLVRVGGRGRKMANGKENYISNYVAENRHLFKLYESKTAV